VWKWRCTGTQNLWTVHYVAVVSLPSWSSHGHGTTDDRKLRNTKWSGLGWQDVHIKLTWRFVLHAHNNCAWNAFMVMWYVQVRSAGSGANVIIIYCYNFTRNSEENHDNPVVSLRICCASKQLISSWSVAYKAHTAEGETHVRAPAFYLGIIHAGLQLKIYQLTPSQYCFAELLDMFAPFKMEQPSNIWLVFLSAVLSTWQAEWNSVEGRNLRSIKITIHPSFHATIASCSHWKMLRSAGTSTSVSQRPFLFVKNVATRISVQRYL